jgi:hypothetical protein
VQSPEFKPQYHQKKKKKKKERKWDTTIIIELAVCSFLQAVASCILVLYY